MADTFQKVFFILVRPYYYATPDAEAKDEKTFHTGHIYNDPGKFWTTPNPYSSDSHDDHFVPGIQLITNQTACPPRSPLKLNKSGDFLEDSWFLHSSYTSYDDFRLALRDLLEVYPWDMMRCGSYIPMDFIPIPRDKLKKRKE